MLRLLLLSMMLHAAPALAEPSNEELEEMLRTVDDRTENSGDYKATVFIEQKETDKSDLVFQALVYRRDLDERLAILMTKPSAEAGKGYLRVDKNLFFYDPAVGKWERRTERERIGGTNSQRQDFDQSRLHQEFDPTWVGQESLGNYQVDHLRLQAKDGADVAYPMVEIWLDVQTGNVLKRQDFALSGKLMRTTYYPRYKTLYSESKGSDVYVAEEVRIFDEVEKGRNTTVIVQEVDLRALQDNIFTKAWLESKSR